MSPAEEDALIARYLPEIWAGNDPVEIGNVRGLIRAAVAQERERIAKEWDGCMYDDVGETVDIGAAIRRGP